MGLAAEVLWSLLPPVTVQTDTLTVAGVLEPCYGVGGDAFDYAINGPVAHWAIFDAMGHGLPASLQATVAVNGYRNARRAGLGLPDIYRAVDAALREAVPGTFVTAMLAELDTTGGQLRYLAAGHPAPLLLRDGALVRTLASPTAMPLGLADQAPRALRSPRVLSEPLRPGDRILSYTDGVVEARNADGVFFGRDQLAAFVGRGLSEATSTAELLRRLIHRVMEHQHTPLRDDASALLVHWHPEPLPVPAAPLLPCRCRWHPGAPAGAAAGRSAAGRRGWAARHTPVAERHADAPPLVFRVSGS